MRQKTLFIYFFSSNFTHSPPAERVSPKSGNFNGTKGGYIPHSHILKRSVKNKTFSTLHTHILFVYNGFLFVLHRTNSVENIITDTLDFALEQAKDLCFCVWVSLNFSIESQCARHKGI